ncbi:hypothetical protein WH7805_05241 [Synechococcus sp. WH 7805]|nr:hypothetical protein WH7805_05241 [Synechococcus sp. WH 7805]
MGDWFLRTWLVIRDSFAPTRRLPLQPDSLDFDEQQASRSVAP